MFQEFSIKVINGLSSSELESFKYINSHKKEVIDMSIHDLAKAVFVSTATISRLCKKLDFEGFSDLKYFLKQLLKKQDEKKNEPMPSFVDMLEEELNDIVKTVMEIDQSMVDEVVELMKQDYHIHFFAKGLTDIVFDYAARHLLSLSKYATRYDDTHIAYAQARNFGPKDMVFLASMSGETEQVLRVAQIAKAKNAKVVTFTASKASTLSNIGDYNFNIVNTVPPLAEIDTKSRCQLMFILNVIIKRYVISTQEDNQ